MGVTHGTQTFVKNVRIAALRAGRCEGPPLSVIDRMQRLKYVLRSDCVDHGPRTDAEQIVDRGT